MRNGVVIVAALILLANTWPSRAEVNAAGGQIRDLQEQLNSLKEMIDVQPSEKFVDCLATNDDDALLQDVLDSAIPGDIILVRGPCEDVTLSVTTDHLTIKGMDDSPAKLIGTGESISAYGARERAVLRVRHAADLKLENLLLTGGTYGLRIEPGGFVLARQMESSSNLEHGALVIWGGGFRCTDCKFNNNVKRGIEALDLVWVCGDFEASGNYIGVGVYNGGVLASNGSACEDYGDSALNALLENNSEGIQVAQQGTVAMDTGGSITMKNNGRAIGVYRNSVVGVNGMDLNFDSNGYWPVGVAEMSSAHLNPYQPSYATSIDRIYTRDGAHVRVNGSNDPLPEIFCDKNTSAIVRGSRVCSSED
jgi:hypothetical protein